MTRCDHCRHPLGARTHRYWQMRFCSLACVDAYRSRLSNETRLKIRLLDHTAEEMTTKPGWPKYGWPKYSRAWRGSLRQHLPNHLPSDLPSYLPRHLPRYLPSLFAR